MKTLVWKNLIGQERPKQVLAAAFSNNSLGHAYLFTGEEGCGTFAAAIDLAMACLCESEIAVPCGTCPSCEKVLRYAHPDFNLIFPVFLSKEHRSSDNNLSAKGWEALADRARSRINDPYLPIEERGQPTIPVEWIREVNQSIGRGVLESVMHVAVIAGIDLMSKESANALLKTLEEPPPRTLILLCTERPHDVLPTIASRCQVLRFGFLPAETIGAALEKRLAEKPADEGQPITPITIRALAETAQGSLTTALRMAGEPLDEELNQAMAFWAQIEKPDWQTLAPMVDETSRGRDFAFFEKLYLCFIYLIRTSFLQGVPGAQKYINTAFRPRSGGLAINAAMAAMLVAVCEEALRGLRANGNQGLLLTNFLLGMMEILHGKEQQAR